MDFNFKKENSLEKRIKDCTQILNDFPNRIPVICERAPNAKFQIITKTKYLCPLDMTVTQFTFLIRQKLNLPQGATIYFLTGDNVTLTTVSDENEWARIKDVLRDLSKTE